MQINRDFNKEIIDQTIRILNERLNNLELRKENIRNWRRKEAKKQQIEIDFTTPSKIEQIKNQLETNLKIRAIPGHAQSGHSSFQGKSRPNTTLDLILNKLNLNSIFYQETQANINLVGELIEKAVRRQPFNLYEHRKEIFGLDLFNQFAPLPLLQGIFYGGFFDNYEQIRKKAEEIYKINIGGGKSHLINKKILMELGIDIEELNTGNFEIQVLNLISPEERIEVFKKIGLIKTIPEIEFDGVKTWNGVLEQAINYEDLYPVYFQEYIREKKGSGVSDDIACLASSFIEWDPLSTKSKGLYYKSLMNGANIADFVDTLTKGTSLYVSNGFDEALAKFANHLWVKRVKEDKKYRESYIGKTKLDSILENPEFGLVSQDEIIDLVALVKNPITSLFLPYKNSDKVAQIHSSARYFLERQIEESTKKKNHEEEKTEIKSFTLEQEMLRNFREINSILKKNNLKIIDIESVLNCKHIISGQKIGYNRAKFNEVFRYMRENIYPILQLPPTQRRDAIKILYNS